MDILEIHLQEKIVSYPSDLVCYHSQSDGLGGDAVGNSLQLLILKSLG